MKLISMIDYVLEKSLAPESMRDFCKRVTAYATFLKEPIGLWMCVPCDEDGETIKEPNAGSEDYHDSKNNFLDSLYRMDLKEYNEAKERVLFENIDISISGKTRTIKINGERVATEFIRNDIDWAFKDCNVNVLVPLDITLTETAIKQLGL